MCNTLHHIATHYNVQHTSSMPATSQSTQQTTQDITTNNTTHDNKGTAASKPTWYGVVISKSFRSITYVCKPERIWVKLGLRGLVRFRSSHASLSNLSWLSHFQNLSWRSHQNLSAHLQESLVTFTFFSKITFTLVINNVSSILRLHSSTLTHINTSTCAHTHPCMYPPIHTLRRTNVASEPYHALATSEPTHARYFPQQGAITYDRALQHTRRTWYSAATYTTTLQHIM